MVTAASGDLGPALASLSAAFRQFATVECRGYCPLYEALALAVADEPEVLALCVRRLPGQPAPNLLFGAVRRLLLGGDDHPLATRYARAATEPGAAWPDFRDFCLSRAEAVASLVSSRRVQTNEVGRSCAFLVAIAHIVPEPGTPLALVDVGASAGLNLFLDRWRYRLRLPDGHVATIGDAGGAVVLECEVRGTPALPSGPPRVASRVGLDLHPIDVRDTDALLWLRALVWPDQPDRERRLEAAAAVARGDPPDLRAGNAADLLPSALDDAPPGATTVVLQSAVTHQIAPADRDRIERCLVEAARRRPVARVVTESPARDGPFVVRVASPGDPTLRPVGRAHPHGAWLQWTGES